MFASSSSRAERVLRHLSPSFRASRTAPAVRRIHGSFPPRLSPVARQGHSSSSSWTTSVASGVALASVAVLCVLSQREAICLDTSSSAAIEKKRLKEVGNGIHGSEIAMHASRQSCWVVVDGSVYDVTGFLDKHPGGAEVILDNGGKDISALFNTLHAAGTLQKALPHLDLLGPMDPTTVIDVVKTSDDEDEVDARRDALPPAELVLNLGEFETLAREVLGEDSRAWRYFSSFADDGASYNSTKNSFQYLRFMPRINVPVAEIDPSTTFFKTKTPFPVFMAPTGQTKNGHPEGELNLTRASAQTGIPQGVSSGSSCHITEILAERDRLITEGGVRTPVWWQLYIRQDRKESERRIREAVEAGADAILITVDVVALGKREADSRVTPSAAGGAVKKDAGLASKSFSTYDANLSWGDIAWVQKIAPGLPVLVKGLGCVDDIALAKKHGAAGVILSNHGGRQLDYAPPPLATLVRCRKEQPKLLEDPEFEVYIDGGVGRGTDVLKALCLGARGVGLGRAMIYAQTCYGDEGILRAQQILKDEIESGMRLLGAKTVHDLRPEMLELLPGLVGERL